MFCVNETWIKKNKNNVYVPNQIFTLASLELKNENRRFCFLFFFLHVDLENNASSYMFIFGELHKWQIDLALSSVIK